MRILVVGTGSIGRRHIGVLKSSGKHEVLICDINSQSVQETAKEYGIQEFYCDYKKALKTDVDAVIICTPNAHHADVCIEALSSGCHVLVEKPIAHKAEDGQKMVEAARKYNRVLMVGYILRVYPGFEDIKRMLNEETVGKPVAANVRLSASATLVLGKSDYRQSYETGGGIIYDYSHEIDYLRYYFGELERYACFKDLQVKKRQTCDDIAKMILQYKSGVLAGIHMDYIQECGPMQNGRYLEIVCEKGFIRYDFNGNVQVYGNDGTSKHIRYAMNRNALFLKQFDIFEKACRNEPVNYTRGEDGLAVLKICDSLYRSDKNNVMIEAES